MTTLAGRLGFDDGTRAVVVSGDELGLSYASNVAVFEALRRGSASTAALMVPTPWARSAAAAYRGEDIGVSLTLIAEHDLYRWAPITHAPSLLDGDGGFPRTVDDLWEHADLDEVRRECRAQLERAIYWGIDVTHLTTHLEGLQLKPEFFDVVLDLAEDFQLPLRLPDATSERLAGFPYRQLATDRGVVSPDRALSGEVTSLEGLAAMVAESPPGVIEVSLRPAIDTPELRAACDDWSARVADHALLGDEAALRSALEAVGGRVVGYRRIREMARAG